MNKDLDTQIKEALKAYLASGVEDQVDYQKFYLYSIVTHSTAIEGSTVTEIENQLLFDEGIAAKGRSLTEQMMNVDLKDAYLYAFKIATENPTYTPQLLQQLSALVMRRTGSEYSTIAGQFDSSKGEFRLCNVSAGIGGRSYLAYNKVSRAVDDFCGWLNQEVANVDTTDIATCYRLSFEAHFRLVTIHPWVDGNGRTTRLVMNMIQRQLGLVACHLRRHRIQLLDLLRCRQFLFHNKAHTLFLLNIVTNLLLQIFIKHFKPLKRHGQNKFQLCGWRLQSASSLFIQLEYISLCQFKSKIDTEQQICLTLNIFILLKYCRLRYLLRMTAESLSNCFPRQSYFLR